MDLLGMALLEPVSAAQPCGADLDAAYDERWLALLREEAGQPERGLGHQTQPAVAPHWPQVRDQARALAAESHDLRLGVTLLRAWLHTEGELGLLAGLVLLRQWVERQWDTLHPQPDAEDDDPQWPRGAALQPLVQPQGLLTELQALLERALPGREPWMHIARELQALVQAVDDRAPGLFEPRALLVALAPWQGGGAAAVSAPEHDPEASPLDGADATTLAQVRDWLDQVDRWAATPATQSEQAQALRRWKREQAPGLAPLLAELRQENPP